MIGAFTELLANLEQQKALYVLLLELYKKQTDLLLGFGNAPDLKALFNGMAEQQYIVERIDFFELTAVHLKESMAGAIGLAGFDVLLVRANLPGEDTEALTVLINDITDLLHAIIEQDINYRKYLKASLLVTGNRVRNVTAGSKAVQAYRSSVGYGEYGTSHEGHFMDHKK